MTNAKQQKNLSVFLGLAIGGFLLTLLALVASRDLFLEIISGAAASVALERLISFQERGK